MYHMEARLQVEPRCGTIGRTIVDHDNLTEIGLLTQASNALLEQLEAIISNHYCRYLHIVALLRLLMMTSDDLVALHFPVTIKLLTGAFPAVVTPQPKLGLTTDILL